MLSFSFSSSYLFLRALLHSRGRVVYFYKFSFVIVKLYDGTKQRGKWFLTLFQKQQSEERIQFNHFTHVDSSANESFHTRYMHLQLAVRTIKWDVGFYLLRNVIRLTCNTSTIYIQRTMNCEWYFVRVQVVRIKIKKNICAKVKRL